jgi:hypothetical protein
MVLYEYGLESLHPVPSYITPNNPQNYGSSTMLKEAYN